MLSLDTDTMLYTLKEQHHHLLTDSAPSSPALDNPSPPQSPPSSPDLGLPEFDPNSAAPSSPALDNPPPSQSLPSSPDSGLPEFDPNSEGLPPFQEGGPDLQQNIPRSAHNIPHHPAYSIPDTTGMYSSGFLPMNVPYWSCGSFREDQCVICNAYH
jgi:hypothetical protein